MASEKTQLKEEKVAIIGSGFIGCSWAMLFAASGYKVSMFDVNPDQVANALENILSQLKNLEKLGLLRGTLSVEEQYQRISKTVTLESCVTGAVYVQESVPENLELKKEVLKSIDLYLSNEALLASSASCIVPSKISEELKHRNQMFVAHPVNPPFFAPAVELVPAPWTDSKIMNKAEKIMNEIGQVPIQLKKECDGFLINRIQYAILQASWQIIKEDIVSVEGLDKVMSEGLGFRYAFIGPLETAYLNANGMLDYAERYADTINRVQKTFSPPEKFEGPILERLQRELSAKVPMSDLDKRRKWRDSHMAGLAKLKKNMSSEFSTT
ncbi:lambdalambda-crystallin-like [Octopus vulgaris]|uniref:Lambdalambda-crystallin-like n=2 Tax=Octopus TaxID=6643 RepID=A0AA36AL54_OCTVU|nr:lambda-crystallin isoform X1 [Octopus sinensis]CAI9717461.1 lambdalambda-crystallin-like [Octopus vulgaris]